MNTSLRVLCAFLLLFQTSLQVTFGQSAAGAGQSGGSQQEAAQPDHLIGACEQPCLEDGTPVRLRMAQTESSATAHVNDRVEFEVLEDLKVSGVVVIPKGGIAWGTVTEAQHKRRMARGGKLEIVMDSVRLADGEKAALRATQGGKGGGHTGAMTAGIVATGLIFFPAAPFFLFMHGKDITIPKGTEVPTFIDGNFHLDLAKFQKGATTVQTAQSSESASPASTNAQLAIASTPAGADIEVDGAFVGNTPSTIGVSAGEHVITVSKKGYKPWERKLTVTSGKIDIAADLEAQQTAEPKPN